MIGDRSLIEEFQKTTAVIGTDHFFFFLIGDRSFTDQMIGDRDICANVLNIVAKIYVTNASIYEKYS